MKASNAGMNDQFGYAGAGVALAGDTLVVGAPGEDSSAKAVDGDQGDGLDPTPGNPQDGFDSGAAYVFWRYGSGWAQQAYLKSSDTAPYDLFGRAVAVSGDTVVVSAQGTDGKQEGVPYEGAVYVFVRDDGKWSRQARLEASNARYKTHFGTSVAISGDTLIVGAIGDGSAAGGVNGDPTDESALNAGAAYVFRRDGTKWSQQACLKAPAPREFDEFGIAVAISGDTAVVGAVDAGAASTKPGAKGKDRGSPITASNAEAGDQFGGAVAISGGTVAAGAAQENSFASGINGDQDSEFRGSVLRAPPISLRFRAPPPGQRSRRRLATARGRPRSGSSAIGRRTGRRWPSLGNPWPSSWPD